MDLISFCFRIGSTVRLEPFLTGLDGAVPNEHVVKTEPFTLHFGAPPLFLQISSFT